MNASDFRYILCWEGASASEIQRDIDMIKQSLFLNEAGPKNTFFKMDSVDPEALKEDLKLACAELEKAEKREEAASSADESDLSFENLESVFLAREISDDMYTVTELLIGPDYITAGPASTMNAGKTVTETKEEFIRTLKEAQLWKYKGTHGSDMTRYPQFVLRLAFRDSDDPLVIRYYDDIPEELKDLQEYLQFSCFSSPLPAGASEWV